MKSVKASKYLYTASLFFFIFLAAVCVAISAVDVIIQALSNKTSTGSFDFRNLAVIGGSYVLLALASFLFSCSRMLTIRGSLQDIPKLYIPIKKEDLPKKVFLKINQEFNKAKQTRKLVAPRPEDIQTVGWAKPGTPFFEDLDFKQAVARTPAIIEKFARNINPDYFRPLHVPVRPYIELLIDEGLIDKDLGSYYLEGYEIARFSPHLLTQEQFKNIMKHVAAIVKNMGYNIKNNAIITDNDSLERELSRQTTTSSSIDSTTGESYYQLSWKESHRRSSYHSQQQNSKTSLHATLMNDLYK
ncbi:uncharacterized protein BX663DRAFT_547759 [Cokeromyces recurvatus]|uniref:uncharacterized protein n=1 Tax=Cokeromyces recurvatus TaxID=90255 RepID=UPI00221F283E|nr:uncharacterized protein BX663DRAFT_547759 [Cokeromyces recurvatus]KAI7908142.1 hypothetical protein BX663DRAFT_547759 [Cokeromyces recurvatus]